MSGSFKAPSLQVTTAPRYYGHGTPFSCLSIQLQTERCDGTTTVPGPKLLNREVIRKTNAFGPAAVFSWATTRLSSNVFFNNRKFRSFRRPLNRPRVESTRVEYILEQDHTITPFPQQPASSSGSVACALSGAMPHFSSSKEQVTPRLHSPLSSRSTGLKSHTSTAWPSASIFRACTSVFPVPFEAVSDLWHFSQCLAQDHQTDSAPECHESTAEPSVGLPPEYHVGIRACSLSLVSVSVGQKRH